MRFLNNIIQILAIGAGSMAVAWFLVFMISLVIANPGRANRALLANYPNISARQIKDNAGSIGNEFGPYARKRYFKCHMDRSARAVHPGECAMLEKLIGRQSPKHRAALAVDHAKMTAASF